MVSYTQRNSRAQLLAAEIYSSLRERRKAVWLDVKMEQLNEAAMKEAAQHSKCVIAIVTGVEREGDPEDDAYFKRPFCMSELRWARAVGVPVQPVIIREDKDRIGEFLGQVPVDLADLGSVDFKALDRISPAVWDTCVDDMIKSIDRLVQAADSGDRWSERGPLAPTTTGDQPQPLQPSHLLQPTSTAPTRSPLRSGPGEERG
jgi:hypothetical protein